MSKKQLVLIIVITVIISWFLNLLFGRKLTAEVSTLPLLNRWHILSPEAPIVITNRETVTLSGNSDISSVAGNVKSKVSVIVLVNNSSAQVTGSALNLTSDGIFVTASSTLTQGQGVYYVELNDGRSAKINSIVSDPATSLVFLKTDLSGVPVINFTESKNANPGDSLAFISSSLQSFMNKVTTGVVAVSQSDTQGEIFQSDYPSRGFFANAFGSLLPGEPVFNTSSDNLGIWNGKQIISSDVLKQALNLYLSSNQKIARPAYGFSYQVLGAQEIALTAQVSGVLVKSVAANSPARQAGLAVSDIITSIDNQIPSDNLTAEEILQGYKPGDVINLVILRGKNTVNLKLTVGELK